MFFKIVHNIATNRISFLNAMHLIGEELTG